MATYTTRKRAPTYRLMAVRENPAPAGAPMSDGARVGLILLGVAVVAGIAIAVNSGTAAAAPAPSPSPASNYLTVVSDPATIKQYQTVLATGLVDFTTPQNTTLPGLSSASYGPSDIDGNASNPRWVSALAIFQKDFNTSMALAIKNGNAPTTPAGFPLYLRTDGVLDYATAVALTNA